VTSYDWLLARRALVLGLAIAFVCFLAIASTDEESHAVGAKVGRLTAFLAASGGLGAFIASGQARARGELRALAAVGVAPARASLGAALGGALVGAGGPILLFARAVDIAPLFPRLPAPTTFRLLTPTAWQDGVRGVVFRASGEIAPAIGAATLPVVSGAPVPRIAAALSLAALAAALPLWGTAHSPPPRRVLVAVSAALVTVVAFHLVAASRGPALLLFVPPLVFLADACWLHGRTRCS
jgi:hypothetical protein